MRGSITIFATMLLMLVSQFLFTVLEAGRNLTLTNIACMNSEAVAESVFAQYCRPLWDEYHLLAYDAGSDAMGNVDIENVKSYMKKLTTDNFKISDSGAFAGGTIVNGTSMLRLSMDELESMKYVLMTDDGGDVYTNAVVSYMKKNIGYETVKNLYSQYSSLNENKSAGEYDDSKIDSALKALKDNAAHEGGGKSIARSSPPRAYSAPSSVSKAKQTSESKAESTEGGNAIENPLVKVQKVKASGILSQVVDDSTVSGNSIDTSARVSGRSLHKGTGGWSESGDDWYAKVLMQQYILTYMSCYTDTNPNHALNYEVEYIIGGRASDKDNLKIVIAEILALRSAANMAYLAGSASKQAQAMALAAIIGGITLTPEVIEGVEKGILAAWAFCESVLDLRALLDGDKIPLIKSDTSWTSSLYGMTSMLTGQVKAKSSNEGIGYKSYLGMLLFTKSMKNIAYRSMDVQEATVRMTGAHESFRMDNAICELSADVSYKYHGIFLCFVNLLDGADNEYTIKNKAKFHIKKLYRKAKLPGDDSSQKMPSCTCLKASYTLEAAVIFPLVAGFFVFIRFFFRVVQVESQVEAALYYSSRLSALASSANDSSVVSVATAEVLFRSRISDSKHIDTYVRGGRYGVSLLGSKMDGDDVSLKAKYKVKLPVSFFTVDGIWIEDYSNSRKWTGKNPSEKTDPYVFYTDYGSVYHLSEQCNYLDLSIKSIKWSQVGASRNKDGRKYHACYCAADKKTEGSTVFITDYGMNYHGKLGCSKLKRTVHKVHKSEVDGKNLCSKCKGEGT